MDSLPVLSPVFSSEVNTAMTIYIAIAVLLPWILLAIIIVRKVFSKATNIIEDTIMAEDVKAQEELSIEQMQHQKQLYEIAVQHLQSSQIVGKDAIGLVQCQQFFSQMAQALAATITQKQGTAKA